MSFLSAIESPFQKVVDKVESIVPASWKDEFGKLAHTFAANTLHDFEVALKAGLTEFESLTAPMLESITSAAEQAAASVAPDVLSGKLAFSAAIEQVVVNLGSTAAKSIVPALKVVGEETLTTIVRSFMASAVAALGASPISPPASSSVASPSASSKP